MYVLDASEAEIERLSVQGRELGEPMDAMFELIGAGPGWRCVDLGCGVGDVTRLLARRVAPHGSVVGVDMSQAYLDVARKAAPEGIAYLRADACATGLPESGFDLVHGRFVTGITAPPEQLIAEAIRLLKPGGTLALVEQEMSSIACFPPHPAFARLKGWMGAGFEQSGTGKGITRRLFGLLRQAGFVDVRFRPVALGVQADSPMAQWLPDTVSAMRRTLVSIGLTTDEGLDEALAGCRAHMADPGTIGTLYTLFQIWGRKPLAEEARMAGAEGT